jgi:predicted Rossmann-fold nucleotide-binding protein
MNKLEKICVFCGSNEGNDLAIVEAARRLGETFAQREITLIYGA